MYRVVIAEDEDIIRKGLVYSIWGVRWWGRPQTASRE